MDALYHLIGKLRLTMQLYKPRSVIIMLVTRAI
jgi:hypothetical protein